MEVREQARAKVNLFLHVVGRRADSYHLLDSLAVFPAIGDHLSARGAEGLSLSLSGPFGGLLAAEPDNLVLRAARALAAQAGVRADATMVLEKNLPVASGIGGGSADAAAALRGLARLWGLSCSADDLARIAISLGADVPVCLAQIPTRMGGVGEALTQAPKMPAYGMVLVNPGIAVATPAVFRARSGGFSAEAALPADWPDAATLAEDLTQTRNDLQNAAISLAPGITEVLQALAATNACLLTRMSGSGATCFGLYPTQALAAQAATTLKRQNWWVWGGDGRPSGSDHFPG